MIVSGITCIAVGVICIILGVLNTKGNISSLHSYHRNNIRKEDIKPFGKRVGAGTIIIGASVLIFGVLSILSEALKLTVLIPVGAGIMTVGIVLGLVITLVTIKKYNKTIL